MWFHILFSVTANPHHASSLSTELQNNTYLEEEKEERTSSEFPETQRAKSKEKKKQDGVLRSAFACGEKKEKETQGKKC